MIGGDHVSIKGNYELTSLPICIDFCDIVARVVLVDTLIGVLIQMTIHCDWGYSKYSVCSNYCFYFVHTLKPRPRSVITTMLLPFFNLSSFG